MRMFLKTLGIAFLLMSLVLVVGLTAAHGTPGGGGETPVTLCHATAAATNPYVVITVDAASAGGQAQLEGHASHTGPIFDPAVNVSGDNWGDIIPAYSYVVANGPDAGTTVTFAGLNIPAGQYLLDNGCQFPVQTTPPPTTVPPTTPPPTTVPPTTPPPTTVPPTTPPPTTVPPPPPTTVPPPPPTTPPTTPPVVPPKNEPRECHGNGADRARCQPVVVVNEQPKGLAFTGSATVPLALGALFILLLGLGMLWQGKKMRA
jgi:hypothetical protein